MITRIVLLVLLGSLGAQGAAIIGSPLPNQFKDHQFSIQRPSVEDQKFPLLGMQPDSQRNKTADMHMLRSNITSHPASKTMGPHSAPITTAPHRSADQPTPATYLRPLNSATYQPAPYTLPTASAPYAAKPFLPINLTPISATYQSAPFYAAPTGSAPYAAPPIVADYHFSPISPTYQPAPGVAPTASALYGSPPWRPSINHNNDEILLVPVYIL